MTAVSGFATAMCLMWQQEAQMMTLKKATVHKAFVKKKKKTERTLQQTMWDWLPQGSALPYPTFRWSTNASVKQVAAAIASRLRLSVLGTRGSGEQQ